ncbi:GerMN domain-containing protein [Paenibacillus turicensis]|uniref:GerMN domain-containing protein n=1 Tax=Paenibacillus turicensis TaxID=160487 RepID=UPI003D2766B4
MKRKLWIYSLMLLTVIVLATGCGQKQQTASPNNDKNSNVTTPAAADPQKDNSEKKDETKETIDAFFTDEQIMDLKKESKEITYKDNNEKYIAALKSLQSANDDKLISLWAKVTFKTAEFKDGLVTVDITLPNEARLGSGGESLAIDALKSTLFQFSEVNEIELLVDGAKVDTLMGHVELEHPMKRSQ